MTSLSLLLWIVLGIALQVGLFLAVSFWQHWQSYNRLKHGQPEADESISSGKARPQPALRQEKIVEEIELILSGQQAFQDHG